MERFEGTIDSVSIQYRENIKPRWMPRFLWRLVRRWIPARWTDWTDWTDWPEVEPDTDHINCWKGNLADVPDPVRVYDYAICDDDIIAIARELKIE